MPKFVATELSGEYVAGRRNPGAGSVFTLTAEEAEHDLRVGALRKWGEPVDAYKERAEAATAPEAAEEPQGEPETPAEPVEAAGEPAPAEKAPEPDEDDGLPFTPDPDPGIERKAGKKRK